MLSTYRPNESVLYKFSRLSFLSLLFEATACRGAGQADNPESGHTPAESTETTKGAQMGLLRVVLLEH